MFLRMRGRQVLLLHNYRDGRGRVRQRCLGRLAQQEIEQLQSPAWQREFCRTFPEIRPDWERLGLKAQGVERAQAPREKRVASLPSLLRQIDLVHDDAALEQLLQAVQSRREANRASLERAEEALAQGDLAAAETELVSLNHKLRPKRRKFEGADPLVQPYRNVNTLLRQLLARQGRVEDGCRVLTELVATCPTPEDRMEVGVNLQQLGRFSEARAHYAVLPKTLSSKHFHLAAIGWEEERPDEALRHLVQGLILERDVAEALKMFERGQDPRDGREYWLEYGHLWSPAARKFFLAVYKQFSIRYSLTLAAERGVRRPRRLLNEVNFAKVLEEALRPSNRMRQVGW